MAHPEHVTILEIVDRLGAIVAADENLELIVAFNGSSTYNLFSKAAGCRNDCWENVDVKTVYYENEDPTIRAAFEEGEDWLQEIRTENEEGF